MSSFPSSFPIHVNVDFIKTIQIHVNLYDTLTTLLYKIKKTMGLAQGYCKFIQVANYPKILVEDTAFDDVTIENLNIKPGISVLYKLKSPLRKEVFNIDLIYDGKVEFLELNPRGKDSVGDLKRMVEDIVGIKSKNQIWKRGIEILHDNYVIQGDEAHKTFAIEPKG